MKKRLLMLGAGFMQGVAIDAAHERGWEVIAVDANASAPCRGKADRFEQIDLKDREALAAFARELQQNGGLDAVFTAATDFTASVSYVAEACALPAHPFQAALNATDKGRMRQRFADCGVPSPAWITVTSHTRADAEVLLRKAGIAYPVVVKPVDNMGARGCRRVDCPEALTAALAEALKYTRSGSVIIEEYMDGPEFSLEALVFDGQIQMTGFADRHIFFPPFFIEMGHTIPTALGETERASIIEVFYRGIRALGLAHGAAKGDLKLTARGPMIGEIAGRLSGGYMSGWTFPWSSGVPLTEAALLLAAGERPASLSPTLDLVCAERAWISMSGRVAKIYGYEAARAIPGVRALFPRVQEGERARFPENNVEKCGNCIACASDRQTAITAAEEACRAIVLRLSAPDTETEAFLTAAAAGPQGFPPDAFSLSETLPDGAGVVAADELQLRDNWQGRTLEETLRMALTLEPGLAQLLSGAPGKLNSALRSRYRHALIRGGIQGILYVYDSTR